jgi:hypothetical protein
MANGGRDGENLSGGEKDICIQEGQVWREAGVVAILGFDVPKAVGNSPAKSLPHLRQAIRDDTRMGALGGPARSSHAKAR